MRKKFALLIILLSLPFLIWATYQVQQYLSKAQSRKTHVVIQTDQVLNPVLPSWNNFAQGGEEPPPQLTSSIEKMRELAPKFIRIDHVFDSFDIVKKTDDGFEYDFTRLDKEIENILDMGAVPFLSLSYMPRIFTSNSSLIDPPIEWNMWKDLIRNTIEHVSGIFGLNLTNVYYEIWNEPDLPQFGSWKLEGTKDYRLLYFYAAQGAKETLYTNNYYLGGPSVGSYYPLWVSGFLEYIEKNNIRLDFYSWHRYHTDPKKFRDDALNIRNILKNYPKYQNLPLILSEWGMDSSNNTNNNTDLSAAFAVSAVSYFHDLINLAFHFEIKDGPPPNGGRWGLIRHEKDITPLSPKPKYYAFRYLNYLKGSFLKLDSTNDTVSGLAAKSEDKIFVILASSKTDPVQTFPLTISGLKNASYRLKYTNVLEQNSGYYDLISHEGKLSRTFTLLPNSVLYLELSKEGQLANFIPGKTASSNDYAILMDSYENPYILPVNSGTKLDDLVISFDIKFTDEVGVLDYKIIEMPLNLADMSLLVNLEFSKGRNFLTFNVKNQNGENKAALEIGDLIDRNWHHIELSLSGDKINFAFDDIKNTQILSDMSNLSFGGITLNPFPGALDNFAITSENNSYLNLNFNGSLN